MAGNVLLKSIGCRTNQEEMGALQNRLLNDGYTVTQDTQDAEIIILNTCSVTGNTESKTKRLINSFSKKNPNAKILLTGCLAQQIPDDLINRDGVEWVVGNNRKKDIPDILKQSDKGMFYSLFDDDEELVVADFNATPQDPSKSGRTRYSLKIQEGCDFSCGYCIVPSLRGPSRSVKREDVLKNCKSAIEAGFKEIVITGTHIGQYRDGDSYDFADLLAELLTLGSSFRIRLSSLDPREFSDKLLNLLKTQSRICDHLHISIQSFSENVLNRMNRIYSEKNEFIKRLRDYKNTKPFAGIGGDFIVGYPGETEDDFNDTLSLVKDLEFNYGHVFRYSVRPGTKAAEIDEQISESVKKDRSDKLRKIFSLNREKFIDRVLQENSLKKIIVEASNPIKGVTSNYIRVEVCQENADKNSWINVKLLGYDTNKNCCIAKVLEA